MEAGGVVKVAQCRQWAQLRRAVSEFKDNLVPADPG